MKNQDKLYFHNYSFSSKKMARNHFKEIRKSNLLYTESLIIKKVKEYIRKIEKKNGIGKTVGIYWPLEGEVDLRGLKESLNSALALPACTTKGEISYRKWTTDPLEKDIYGIPSPLSQPPIEAKEMSLLIVPALAIDRLGTRLGYGSGCFDRLRAKDKWKTVQAFAVVPSKCITSSLLPRDEWDIPFDGWINEKEIFQIKDFDIQ